MEFRPCIDIHNGAVKQIVGSSLSDKLGSASNNFISEKGAAYYANLYKEMGLFGGHIIILNSKDSDFYEEGKKQALSALKAFPYGMQIGGGINIENAAGFLENGASHVIVTSAIFKNGMIDFDMLEKFVNTVGKEHLVLDLSCKEKDGEYYIVTDRWQKFTSTKLCEETLDILYKSCDEFLIHAADVEGKRSGIDIEVAKILGKWGKAQMTYAGGVHNLSDIDILKKEGMGKVNVTVGSALDIFGGNLKIEDIIEQCK